MLGWGWEREVVCVRGRGLVGLPQFGGARDVDQRDLCFLRRQTGIQVWCWGYNTYGHLGDGSTTARTTPVLVVGLPGNATNVDCGHVHTCAISNSSSLWCWGYNGYGQLGDGSTTQRSTPVSSGSQNLRGVLEISAGEYFTCVLKTGGSA